jgi:hypothetical protein
MYFRYRRTGVREESRKGKEKEKEDVKSEAKRRPCGRPSKLGKEERLTTKNETEKKRERYIYREERKEKR